MVNIYQFKAPIILELSGKDSLRYLNARLSNDLKNIVPGRALRAAALTPHGKTEGLYLVLQLAEQRYLLICDGGSKEEVIAALKRYMVADRIEVDSDLVGPTSLELYFEIGEFIFFIFKSF